MPDKEIKASPNREAFFISIVCLSLLVICPLSGAQENIMNSRELIDQLMKGIDNVKTLKYNLEISERSNGPVKSYESKVKLQCSPRKLYLNLNGTEVLWLEGVNNGNALVNPNSFPYINLNLNPYGSLMIGDQHHTIYEVGYDYFREIIAFNALQAGPDFDKIFLYKGEEKVEGKDAYKVIVLNEDFAFVHYKVKKEETLISIARRLRLSEYMIKERNPKIKSYTDIREGQDILIPNYYAKMTVMDIDKQYHVPLVIRVYDDRGLFESYEYRNLQVNPPIAPEEFTKDYKDYHF